MARRHATLAVAGLVAALGVSVLTGPVASSAATIPYPTLAGPGRVSAEVFAGPQDSPTATTFDALGVDLRKYPLKGDVQQDNSCTDVANCAPGVTYTSNWTGDTGDTVVVAVRYTAGVENWPWHDVADPAYFSSQQLSNGQTLYRRCDLINGVRSTSCLFSVLVTLPQAVASTPVPVPAPSASTPSTSPPSATPLRLTYAALGDSYSSGEGNPPFDAGTDTATNTCHRSSLAWPRLLSLSTAYVMTSTKSHIACSGITTAAIANNTSQEPSQAGALRSLSPAPDVVTLTLGGNNAQFASAVKYCIVAGSFNLGTVCTRRLNNIRNTFSTISAQLAQSYEDIHEAAPGARILVVGYPNPVQWNLQDRGKRCSWLTRDIAQQVSAFVLDLDRMIKRTSDRFAATANTTYVDTYDVFDGHGICAADNYVIRPNKKNNANSYTAHPNAFGQGKIADRVSVAMNALPLPLR